METIIHEIFDLQTLLTMDSINLRRLAQEFPSLTVEQFFDALTAFIRLVPFVKKALDNISDLNEDTEDFNVIDDVIKSLESIGNEKFMDEFHSLLSDCDKEENWKDTAIHAKKMRKSFAEFCSQISETKGGRSTEVFPFAALPLGEYIKKLDEEDLSFSATSLGKSINPSSVGEAKHKPCILAVDDSPAILSSLSAVLGGNYKVFTLPKPTELAKVLQKLTPDLFLLDYLMPELNGFDLVPIIRSFEKHKDTPIIFLTSAGTLDNVTAAIAIGARDFIVKPFNSDVLREKIAKHIGDSGNRSPELNTPTP